MNIGDKLNQLAVNARHLLFRQAELAELTYGAFGITVMKLQEAGDDQITVNFPLGLRPDRQPIQGTSTYTKPELIEQYKHLAVHQLSVNGLFQIVAIIEALLGDIVRALVLKYPQKLGAKRSMPLHAVLEATSINDVHLRAADLLLNELAYKSPAEFAEALHGLISMNLLECPAYHKYMEVKASRDIFIHNRGVANEIYERKSGTHSRAHAGMSLPADIQYFLESYESCLQLTEWLEKELHSRWHSSEYEARRSQSSSAPPAA